MTFALATVGLAGLALAAAPASADSFRALGSVTSPAQYVGDTAGTTFRVAVNNPNAAMSVGAVSVSAPTGWRIVSCPAAPVGWSRSLVAGQCRFVSAPGSARDLPPHATTSSFRVKATTRSAAADLVGRWTVRAYRASGFTGTPAVASPGSSSMVTRAYSLQVRRVLVAATPAAGAVCPAAANTAPAGSLRTLVVCAVNRSTTALTPVFDHSRLTGTFAVGGSFRSSSASVGPATPFLASWRDVTIQGAGTNRTVGVRLGTATGKQSSPTTTFGGFTSTAPPANHAPSAAADTSAVRSDAVVNIPVLANDTDPDGDVLHIGSVDTAGTVGLVTANSDGTVTYDPRGLFTSLAPGSSTTDTFRYRAADASATSEPALVTVTVTAPPRPPGPVNQPPAVVADAGTASYTENGPAVVVSPGLTVTDGDSPNLQGATVAVGLGFRPGQDQLAFVNTAAITGAYNGTTGVLTLTGAAPVADYQAALQTVTFLAGGDDPGSAARTINFRANDGSATSSVASRDVAVTPVNDAPSASMTAAPLSYTEGGSPLVDSGLAVTDPDSANLAGATMSITSNFTAADGDRLNFVNTPSITASYNSGTGVLTLTGADTVAHYETALRSVTFTTTSDNPSTATRTVSVVANDGLALSTVATRDITVAVVNDAPVVATAGGATTYTEGDPPTPVDGSVTVADVDDTSLNSGQVRISAGFQPGDQLVFTNQNGITGAYNSGTGVLALSGTATVADYQTALRTTKFYATSDNPVTSKTVELTVNDGDVDSNAATKGITLTGINDAPTVTTSAGTAAYTENGSPVVVDSALSVTDPDSTILFGATVVITGNFSSADGDTLAFTPTATITGGYNSVTGLLSMSGSDTVANYQAILRTVTFSNTSEHPSTFTRTISVRVTDDGPTNSNIATRDVTVTAVNDAPVATDQSLSTNEDTALPVTLSGTDPDGDALTFSHDAASAQGGTVSGLGGSPTYTPAANYCGPDSFGFTADDGNGGTDAGTISLTVTCVNDAPVVDLNGAGSGTDDTATFSEQVTHTGGAATLAPTGTLSDVDSNNLASLTVTLTNHPDGTAEHLTATTTGTSVTADSYDSTTGVLLLHGTDTLAHYQQVLRTVAYRNDAAPPDATARTVTFVANDGLLDSNTATTTVTVVALNAAPVVDLNGGSAGRDVGASFTEDAGAVTLAPSAAASDADDANLASATVTLTNRPDGSAESLAATVSGTSITADAYDAATGVLSLHGADTVAHYQQVLRTVVYGNVSDTPDTTNRSVTFVANDGQDDSAVATATVTVTAANDAPTLDLNGAAAGVDATASYTEDQPASVLVPSAVAADVDNANLQSATVTLTNHPDGAAESLSVDTTGTSITPVAYNSGTGVLALSGADTLAHYQQVLRTVAYLNSSQNADTTARAISFVINDGAANSNTPAVTLAVNVVNDAPVVDLNGAPGGIDSSAAFVEDSSPNVAGSGPVNLGPTATVTDVDNAALASATLTLTNHPDGASESLSVNLAGSPHITTGGYNSSTGVLTLIGGAGATPAEFQAAIRSATYNNTSNTPDATDRDVTVVVNDGAADSATTHATVSVTPTNDAPVAGDETFNAANSAIGNTTLNVNDTNNHGGVADGRPSTPDPTDTSPVTDRPHKTITGDILANDTDPESANSALTVTAGTFATNDGGTVTLQSDGDFNFEPAPATSCTDTSDFFDYTVNDNASVNATDTGRVTVAITGCVWYVNNNDAQGNSGTSEKPFDTLAQAQTASAAGSSIFVYDGDDTTTGYNAGITLKSNQQLLSEAATLTIGSDTLHSADAANKASLTNNNADVVTLAGGTIVKGFNVDPQGGGGGIFGTGLGASTITLDDLNVVDVGNNATQPGLELSTTAGTTTNISNLTVNNGDGNSATTNDEGVRLTNAGTVNFANTGTISITTNGAAGLDAAAGAGTTSLGSASIFDDITVTNSGNGGVLLSGTTGSNTWFGDGSGNDLQLTTVSGAAAAFSAQTAGSFAVLSGGQSDVSATGGPAVDVVSSSGSTMAFDSVSSTNSANDGINIDSIGLGTFSATSGSIGGEAGIGFDLNGGSGAITYPGTFNNGSGPLVAEVTGRTGGGVSLSGNMNDTNDAGGGINESGNMGGSDLYTGATKQFNTGASDALTVSNPDGSTHTTGWAGGGASIHTTSGNGVNVTGVGPTPDGSVQFSGSGNTIDSTALGATNRALNVSDVNLFSPGAPADLFDRISSNGGANGIRLNNTGSIGGLNVTGVGGTCTSVDTSGCSGGTIQNATGADDSGTSPIGTGIALKSTKGVSLTRMHILNNSNYGIRGDNVTGGFVLANSVLDGANGTELPASAGSPFNESAIRFTELTGAGNAINNSAISGGVSDNVGIINSTGTLNRMTFQGDIFGDNSATQGNRNIDISGTGTSTMNVTVDGSTFTASRSHDFGYDETGVAGDVIFTNNNLTQSRPVSGPGAPATGAGNVKLTSGSSANVTFNVASNTMSGATGNAMLFVHDVGGGDLTGTVNSNTIGVAGTADSGSLEGDGIQLNTTGGTAGANTSVAITNNQIHQYNNFGIELASGSSGVATETGNIAATVTGNTVSNPGTNASIGSIFQGIQLNTGTVAGQSFQWCTNIKGNSMIGSGRNGGTDFRVRQRQATTVRLPGYGGGNTDTTAVTNFIANQNDANPNSAGAEPPTPTGAAITDPAGGGFVGGAACSSG